MHAETSIVTPIRSSTGFRFEGWSCTPNQKYCQITKLRDDLTNGHKNKHSVTAYGVYDNTSITLSGRSTWLSRAIPAIRSFTYSTLGSRWWAIITSFHSPPRHGHSGPSLATVDWLCLSCRNLSAARSAAWAEVTTPGTASDPDHRHNASLLRQRELPSEMIQFITLVTILK